MDKEIQYERCQPSELDYHWKKCTVGNVPILCSQCGRILVPKLVKKITKQHKDTLFHYKYYNYVCKRAWWDIFHPKPEYRRIEITKTETDWMAEQIKIFQRALDVGRDREEIRQIILSTHTELEACEIIDGIGLNDKETNYNG